MPGVDFDALRASIAIAQVLELIGFEAKTRQGDQLRGSCPLHGGSSANSRTFSVNLKSNRFQCFKCGQAGGQLELWASFRSISVDEATIELCDRLGIDVPWIRRW